MTVSICNGLIGSHYGLIKGRRYEIVLRFISELEIFVKSSSNVDGRMFCVSENMVDFLQPWKQRTFV